MTNWTWYCHARKGKCNCPKSRKFCGQSLSKPMEDMAHRRSLCKAIQLLCKNMLNISKAAACLCKCKKFVDGQNFGTLSRARLGMRKLVFPTLRALQKTSQSETLHRIKECNVSPQTSASTKRSNTGTAASKSRSTRSTEQTIHWTRLNN